VYNAVSDPAAGDWSSLLSPIDYSIVDQSQLIPGYAAKYGVAHDLYASVIAYNTKILGGKVPANWKDFLNANGALPGKSAMPSVAYDGPEDPIEISVIANAAGAGSGYPVDESAAKATLEQSKSRFVYFTSATQVDQLLTTQRVSMADEVASHVYELQSQGYPIAAQWNQNISAPDWMEVPKGAPDQKLDMEFIDYCNTKAPQLAYSALHPNGPINKDAAAALPPKLAEELPSSPAHIAESKPMDVSYWTADVEAKLTTMLQQLELG
jgi:putative spermidine/putrescine transport system substrate-binding protein